jgi:hypothetical protein
MLFRIANTFTHDEGERVRERDATQAERAALRRVRALSEPGHCGAADAESGKRQDADDAQRELAVVQADDPPSTAVTADDHADQRRQGGRRRVTQTRSTSRGPLVAAVKRRSQLKPSAQLSIRVGALSEPPHRLFTRRR